MTVRTKHENISLEINSDHARDGNVIYLKTKDINKAESFFNRRVNSPRVDFKLYIIDILVYYLHFFSLLSLCIKLVCV